MITICDPSFCQKLEDNNCTKLIAIVDSDFGISKNENIPWIFDDDIRFFKTVTQNFAIIMGRKTFFSIANAPLKNRVNCVLSNTIKSLHGVLIFDSLEAALRQYKNAWIIGGAEIYNYALRNNLVDYSVITQVHKKFESDKFIEKSFLESFKKKILFTTENYDITSYLRV